jgi:para-nitrobenzyl esterase
MIFGQSGGGWKVSTLLAMPAAQGLFHRAAVQSGSLLHHVPREAGAAVAGLLLQKLGISGNDLRALRDVPWSQMLSAQAELGAHLFAPVLDGIHLPRDPGYPDAPPQSRDVPLIVSTTLDDAGLFVTNFELDEAGLKAIIRLRYGERADALLSLYRELFPTKSAYLLYSQIITDAGFRRFAHAQAERKALQGGAPVYSYLWEWASPAFDSKFGAVHAMDVSASFHNDRDAIVGGGSRAARELCETLAAVWVRFAQTGNPNGAGIPEWSPFDTHRRATLILGPTPRVEHDPYAALRKFWLDMPEASSVLG